jgi:uncharacterized protein
MFIFWTILAFVLMLVGLLGIVLPFLPGVPLAWLGLLAFAWGTGFEHISLKITLIFLGISALSMILDFFIPLLAGKKYQASKKGMLGAGIGMILGIFTANPFGFLIFALLGAFLGELLGGKEARAAYKSTWGFFLGFVLGGIVKIVVVLAMIGTVIFSLIK